ncbi:unnamed protein product [Musa hybrid cultivar]
MSHDSCLKIALSMNPNLLDPRWLEPHSLFCLLLGQVAYMLTRPKAASARRLVQTSFYLLMNLCRRRPKMHQRRKISWTLVMRQSKKIPWWRLLIAACMPQFLCRFFMVSRSHQKTRWLHSMKEHPLAL